MQSSGSCESAAAAAGPGALERLALARLHAPAVRAEPDDAEGPASGTREAATGFASLLYTELFKQMQQTVERGGDEEDDGDDEALTEGVHDFLGLYLPIELVRARGEPVSRQIARYLEAQLGAPSAEAASEAPAPPPPGDEWL